MANVVRCVVTLLKILIIFCFHTKGFYWSGSQWSSLSEPWLVIDKRRTAELRNRWRYLSDSQFRNMSTLQEMLITAHGTQCGLVKQAVAAATNVLTSEEKRSLLLQQTFWQLRRDTDMDVLGPYLSSHAEGFDVLISDVKPEDLPGRISQALGIQYLSEMQSRPTPVNGIVFNTKSTACAGNDPCVCAWSECRSTLYLLTRAHHAHMLPCLCWKHSAFQKYPSAGR